MGAPAGRVKAGLIRASVATMRRLAATRLRRAVRRAQEHPQQGNQQQQELDHGGLDPSGLESVMAAGAKAPEV
jgi:hypothetical protein